jgi:peptidyl-prolyl cis-trans isomerase SurA
MPIPHHRACLRVLIAFNLFIGLGLWSAAAGTGAELVERIVAVVNEDIIMLSELEQANEAYAQRIRSMGYDADRQQALLARARQDVLDQLVNQKLTDQQIKRYNLSVSEKDVDKAIERILSSQSIGTDQLNAWLAREAMTLEAYREQVKTQLLRSKLLNYQVKSKIVVTREEVESYYRLNIAKYGGDIQYHLRTYLARVPADAPAEIKRAAQERMQSVHQALKAGKSPEQDGVENLDLGWFSPKGLSAQIRDLIKDLQPNQFTDVLAMEQGFQIIRVDAVETSPAGKSLEQASAEIEEDLYKSKLDEKFTAWLKDLRQNSHIKIIE